MNKDKNTMFSCRGNEEADNLLCMLESNAVLSESFKLKIQNIILVILTNLEKNEDWVEEGIKKLKEEMDWLMIFSPEFKGMLTGQLLLTFHRQKALNKEKV